MDREDNGIVNDIPQAAQFHLSMLQSIIQRMATNSASCKTWCITLVSGLVVVLFTNSNFDLFPIVLTPIILFFILDVYYLALEKRFRDSYNNFIRKAHNGTVTVYDLFVINPSNKRVKSFFKAIISFSIWPFYLILFLLNLFIYVFLLYIN